MRWPNDIRLAQEVPEIDFIFGGHDHDYEVNDVEGMLCVLMHFFSHFCWDFSRDC